MKTALVTGACINTGVAIVEKFASEGYNVVFTGRNAEKVHAKEREYKEKYPNRQFHFPAQSVRRHPMAYQQHLSTPQDPA